MVLSPLFMYWNEGILGLRVLFCLVFGWWVPVLTGETSLLENETLALPRFILSDGQPEQKLTDNLDIQFCLQGIVEYRWFPHFVTLIGDSTAIISSPYYFVFIWSHHTVCKSLHKTVYEGSNFAMKFPSIAIFLKVCRSFPNSYITIFVDAYPMMSVFYTYPRHVKNKACLKNVRQQSGCWKDRERALVSDEV